MRRHLDPPGAPDLQRRLLGRGCLLATFGSAALLPQRPALAAQAVQAQAFRGLHALIGVDANMPVVGAEVALVMDEQVDNGAAVPLSVRSRLVGAQEIFIVVPTNPQPLAAHFFVPQGTEAAVATRIKLAQSATVYAAVVSAGSLYCAARDVKVTVGGCGA
jgi:sulfur-oxidizing protein SoxY